MAAVSAEDDDLQAWSLPHAARAGIGTASPWPGLVDRDWAWGGSTGAGVRVAVVDSGIDAGHPAVAGVAGAVAVNVDGGDPVVADDTEGDACGHGTACASIIRSLAPDCELWSVRVLGAGFTGSGGVLVAGLEWAVEHGFDVINLSLSTTKGQFREVLYRLADRAYFRRSLVVAAAHNMPVESYPWRFASVVSVGSHEEEDPFAFYANPTPPVEFFARGVGVQVAWVGGATLRSSGNSFATPHISGIAALVLAKHRQLTPFQLKSVLTMTATNAEAARDG
jgi:subtilisin